MGLRLATLLHFEADFFSIFFIIFSFILLHDNINSLITYGTCTEKYQTKNFTKLRLKFKKKKKNIKHVYET